MDAHPIAAPQRRLRMAVLFALAASLAASMLPMQGEPAQAWPIESHCGTETGGPPFDGFISHEQVGHRKPRVHRRRWRYLRRSICGSSRPIVEKVLQVEN